MVNCTTVNTLLAIYQIKMLTTKNKNEQILYISSPLAIVESWNNLPFVSIMNSFRQNFDYPRLYYFTVFVLHDNKFHKED